MADNFHCYNEISILMRELHVAVEWINRPGNFIKLEQTVVRTGNARSGQINDMLGNRFKPGPEVMPGLNQQVTFPDRFDAGVPEHP